MQAVHVAVAFALGYLAKQLRLPPLVGFLAAGFALYALGVRSNEGLQALADFGVTLLLFSIGLKLKLKTLFRPEVWGTAVTHMGITVLVFGLGCLALGLNGIVPFDALGLGPAFLVAFALSFSSTVFAVKAFEERGEMGSRAGRIAIGILIMQDMLAVVFLTLSAGKTPSPWAFALLGLPLIRPLLARLLSRTGHGELLVLLGMLLPFAGGELFRMVGLKPDLGAIVFGVLLAGHPKAGELSAALLSLKDLFLVGFFLTIGLSAAPTWGSLGIAVLLVVLMPVKVGLFYILLTRFRLRARPATLATLGLANYSEFGLIVGAVGVSSGWIGPEWLVIMALAVSLTFVLASPLNSASHAIYARYEARLKRLETDRLLSEDRPIDPGESEVVVIGMGRTGTSAFDRLVETDGEVVLGIDRDRSVVERHAQKGRHVILGDATDLDFWKLVQKRQRVRLVLVTIQDFHAVEVLSRLVKTYAPCVVVAATARYDDEVARLEALGVDSAYNLYAEAGVGFARDVSRIAASRAAAAAADAANAAD